MIRKTALLTAAAAALMAAPALAQDATAAPETATPVEAQAETQAQAQGTVSPGAQVRASDGTTQIGVLEGATVDASGQQALAVRAEDGALKTVPMAGASLQDGAVVTAWTEAEFDAAPSVTDSTAEASATAPAQPAPEAAPPAPATSETPEAVEPKAVDPTTSVQSGESEPKDEAAQPE